MVRIAKVSKIYRAGNEQVRALDDVSLEVNAGEFAAVQGPSGCGKTTLLLMAGGLLQPDAGSVEVDGEDIYAMSLERRAQFRARKIGFVFQQFHLIPYLSVRDNVLAPTLALPISGAAERVEELLGRFNLTSRAAHTPGELSTGERQRVALARAMLHEPRMILADEPTGNLDEHNAAIVLGALAGFAEDGGTVLLVTHDRMAAGEAGRLVRLDAGKLADDGGSSHRDQQVAG
ncbi:MAG: ABC transporter ATP-binding protein [candidate division WS1 bacterium]|jgi:ABC-type lipoprotein export system ATPase subunit|nr:ABC transporter ATP-binding protein [candidate division WS1 bacterium]